MLSPIERGEIYRRVRSILVCHWLDLGLLNIKVGETSLSLSGRLERLEHVKEQLSTDIIEGILGELRRVPGVKFIQAEFINWKRSDDSLWHPTGAGRGT